MTVREIIGNNSLWMPNARYGEQTPLITVILPTYSRAKSGLLTRCINSILNQSFRRFELIIVDDGSVDGSFQICKDYMQRDPRVNIIRHHKNMGLPAISTYEAYQKARGNYIAYAFDDNVWELDALSATYDFMEENEVKASFGIAKALDPATGQMVEFGHNGKQAIDMLWASNQIGAGAVMLHREVLETVGLHDPHLSLTRVCDWDLWLRIIDKFDFIGTEIPFTTEYGATLSDSLGNAFKLDYWFFSERQQIRDEECLLPQNYDDCDVLGGIECCSKEYFRYSCEYLEQYSNRYWYKDIYESCGGKKEYLSKKKILIITLDKTASLMSFTRSKSNQYVFFYMHQNVFIPSMVGLSDIIVYSRVLPDAIFNDKLIRSLKIPVYYYVDDNFNELALTVTEPMIYSLAMRTNPEMLKRFEGIIVSSEALRAYFVKRQLHDNVIVLDPIHGSMGCTDKKKSDEVTIGFMGGGFRESVLKSCVLPALKNITKRHKIRLVLPCTEDTYDSCMELEADNFSVTPKFRTLNYERIIWEYQKENVDILIHCGRNHRNNLYKTKNALINAASLGAALIASDIEPYCEREGNEPEDTYLTVRNTPREWETALKRLISDRPYRQKIAQAGQNYCRSRYSPQNAWRELCPSFDAITSLDEHGYLKRYEQMVGLIITNMAPSGGAAAFGKKIRPYIPEQLSYTGEFSSPRRFGFTSEVEYIREIGLLFAVTGECTGKVHLKIFRSHESEPIECVSLDMSDLVKDGYTNFYLINPILRKKANEKFIMEITCQYTEKNGYVGLFEDRNRRTFFYKVCNKLGHPISGKNALFVDCRG